MCLMKKPKSVSRVTTSSSFVGSPNPLLTATSDSVSLEVMAEDIMQTGTGVELSLWLQWTIMKCAVKVYGKSSAKNCGKLCLYESSVLHVLCHFYCLVPCLRLVLASICLLLSWMEPTGVR